MRDNFWKWVLVLVGGIVGLWVNAPNTIKILLMLMGLDILSGLTAAFNMQTMNSSIMFIGLVRKCAIFILLALVHVIESPLGLPVALQTGATIAFIIYEAMSIIENCANSGAPVPQVLVVALAKVKIPLANPAEITREFQDEDSRTFVSKTTEIIATPPNKPDIKVETVTTLHEEKRITPIKPTDAA